MRFRQLFWAATSILSLFTLSLATGCTTIFDGDPSSEENRQGLTEEERENCSTSPEEILPDSGCAELDGGIGEDAGFEEDGGGDDGERDANGGDEPGGDEPDGEGGGGEDVGGGGEEDGSGGDDPRKAISFVAFCVEDGSLSQSDITSLDVTTTKDGGEPLAVSWDSSTSIDRVVLKIGGGALAMENFDASGATSGTATVGGGTDRLSSQTPSSPCPDGESGTKFEF